MGVAENLVQIQTRIRSSAESVRRDPESITLVAVSKFQSIDLLWEAYEAGQRHFGESRLQEALPKIEAMPKDVTWHFIGGLQTNKVRKSVEVFDCVHTFCKVAHLTEAEKANGEVTAFIEVNIANEPQKSGLPPEMLDEFAQNLLKLHNVHFHGLMTIGPVVDEVEQMRPYFRELHRLNEKLGLTELSMGMSGDFEVAIQEGASHVRVGSAIFGSRNI